MNLFPYSILKYVWFSPLRLWRSLPTPTACFISNSSIVFILTQKVVVSGKPPAPSWFVLVIQHNIWRLNPPNFGLPNSEERYSRQTDRQTRVRPAIVLMEYFDFIGLVTVYSHCVYCVYRRKQFSSPSENVSLYRYFLSPVNVNIDHQFFQGWKITVGNTGSWRTVCQTDFTLGKNYCPAPFSS